ncbi:MAG: hypothetical protein FJ109_04805 [Deltaproteobacteria bacterium]|nr:hypothetical protein [Deltaproteobacteria bacterium]
MKSTPGREQLQDACVAAWVLGRLSLASRYERVQEVAELRDLLGAPEAAAHVFCGDERLAASMLAEMPSSAVVPHVARLAKCWEELPDAVAAQAAVRLAALHPPGLVAMLEPLVDQVLDWHGDVRLAGIVAAAGRAGPAGLGLLDRIELAGRTRLAPYRLLHCGFYQAAIRLDRPGTARLIARLLEADDATGFEVQSALSQAFSELAPGCPTLSLVTDLEERGYGYRLVDLPELFAPGAPIDELDALALFERGTDLKSARRLLRRGAPPPRLAAFAHELSEALGSGCSGFGRRGAYLFVVAAAAAGFVTETPDLAGMSLQALLDLYTCDVSELPCARILERAIVARAAPTNLPELLAELSACIPYRGGERMVRLAARYLPARQVEPLAACLGEECDGRAAAAAAVELARRGDAALDWLAARFAAFDHSQRMRVLEVLAAAATDVAAGHLARLFAQVREDPFELALWCDAAAGLGDPALLGVMSCGGAAELDEARQVLTALSNGAAENCRKRALQGSNL